MRMAQAGSCRKVMIRRSSPEEAATLTQIALDAKRYWGYPEHWIRIGKRTSPSHPISFAIITFMSLRKRRDTRVLRALLSQGNKAELEHMWVTPASIGTGIGKELFLDAMERAAALRSERSRFQPIRMRQVFTDAWARCRSVKPIRSSTATCGSCHG